MDNTDEYWDKRFKEGDIVEIPTSGYNKYCFYVDKKDIYSLCSNMRDQYFPGSIHGKLCHCHHKDYKKLLNIFDFEDSENIQKILTGNDMESITFIVDYLRHQNEKKKKN